MLAKCSPKTSAWVIVTVIAIPCVILAAWPAGVRRRDPDLLTVPDVIRERAHPVHPNASEFDWETGIDVRARFTRAHDHLLALYGTRILSVTRVNLLARALIQDLFVPTPNGAYTPFRDASFGVVGGSATAGACVEEHQRWTDVLRAILRRIVLGHRERVASALGPAYATVMAFDSISDPCPPTVIGGVRSLSISNAAHEHTNTTHAVRFLPALFEPNQDLVAWEYTESDRHLETGGANDDLRDAHSAFVRRVTYAHPDAVVAWVFLWDAFQWDITSEPFAVPSWRVEETMQEWRHTLSDSVPQLEVSLARLLHHDDRVPGVVPARCQYTQRTRHLLTCDGVHPGVDAHRIVADLVVFALARAIVEVPRTRRDRAADALWSADARTLRANGVAVKERFPGEPWWVAETLKGRVVTRGFPFKLPLHAASAYAGEEMLCDHPTHAGNDSSSVWVSLEFDTLSGFRCDQHDFFWTGRAFTVRGTRRAALEVPDCKRGNFTMRFPYTIKTFPSLPCMECVCGVQHGGDGHPFVQEADPVGIPPHTAVSVCCPYRPYTPRSKRQYLHELFMVAVKP